MFNLVSLIIGAIAALLAIPAFLPLLGWMNWLIVPVAVVGLLFGLASGSRGGRNLNLVVIALGVVRLMLGGGLF
ncbi:MAG: hypothetical protein QOJ27_898 [Sphingomonadales bacterium]|nr:hypothetical protein [Sphingomonadales bacterium]